MVINVYWWEWALCGLYVMVVIGIVVWTVVNV